MREIEADHKGSLIAHIAVWLSIVYLSCLGVAILAALSLAATLAPLGMGVHIEH